MTKTLQDSFCKFKGIDTLKKAARVSNGSLMAFRRGLQDVSMYPPDAKTREKRRACTVRRAI